MTGNIEASFSTKLSITKSRKLSCGGLDKQNMSLTVSKCKLLTRNMSIPLNSLNYNVPNVIRVWTVKNTPW